MRLNKRSHHVDYAPILKIKFFDGRVHAKLLKCGIEKRFVSFGLHLTFSMYLEQLLRP
jgi:hypothetical protein